MCTDNKASRIVVGQPKSALTNYRYMKHITVPVLVMRLVEYMVSANHPQLEMI